jgi:hypothetical protein
MNDNNTDSIMHIATAVNTSYLQYLYSLQLHFIDFSLNLLSQKHITNATTTTDSVNYYSSIVMISALEHSVTYHSTYLH